VLLLFLLVRKTSRMHYCSVEEIVSQDKASFHEASSYLSHATTYIGNSSNSSWSEWFLRPSNHL